MHEKIASYGVLDFESGEKAMEVATKLMDFVSKPEGHHFLAGANRAVVWIDGKQLFVSDGAISAAAIIGLTLNPSARIAPDQLPASRSLMVGDARDWDI